MGTIAGFSVAYRFNGNLVEEVGSTSGTISGSGITYGPGRSSPAESAAYLTGAGIVRTGLTTNLAAFSISAWIKPTANNNVHTIATKLTSLAQDFEFRLGVNAGDGRLVCFLGNGTAWSYPAAATVVPLNVWSHVAVTYDGTTIRTFFNGVQDSATAGPTPYVRSASELTLGGRNYASYPAYFNGGMDEVLIYPSALTATDIRTLAESRNLRDLQPTDPSFSGVVEAPRALRDLQPLDPAFSGVVPVLQATRDLQPADPTFSGVVEAPRALRDLQPFDLNSAGMAAVPVRAPRDGQPADPAFSGVVEAPRGLRDLQPADPAFAGVAQAGRGARDQQPADSVFSGLSLPISRALRDLQTPDSSFQGVAVGAAVQKVFGASSTVDWSGYRQPTIGPLFKVSGLSPLVFLSRSEIVAGSTGGRRVYDFNSGFNAGIGNLYGNQ